VPPVSDQDNISGLQEEGLAWVERMTSGSATHADAAALAQWRNQSRDHAAALRQAILLRQTCQELAQERSFQAVVMRRRKPRVSRSIVLGTFAVIFAGAAAWAAVDPPLGLWPSVAEIRADYRTVKGEQRTIVLGDVSLQLNTLTSVSRNNSTNGLGVTVIEGEIAATTRAGIKAPLSIRVNDVTVTPDSGTVNVRSDGAGIVVTAVDTTAEVDIAGQRISLAPKSQIKIEDGALLGPTNVDVVPVIAWRQHELLLRDASVAAAVREINRYRPGYIVIGSSRLASRKINAVLQLKDISKSLDLLCRLTGAHSTAIGEYVVLS
jgi:transmembrane sensor